jgi:pimeloyl-ACP methyl ester carboxylesterase
VPLIVLAAGQSVEHDPLWQEAQEQLARDSSNAKLIVASGSGHYIHWEQPTLVVDAIRQVVEAARANQQLKP